MAVYVSSGAFCTRDLAELVERAEAIGLSHLELSSGVEHAPDFEALVPRLESSPLSLLVHNYFPAPETPFVLNLGAADPRTLDASRAHARGAIDLCARLGAPFYSVHAPFALALTPEVLGRPEAQADMARARGPELSESTWATFEDSLRALAPHAAAKGVGLLVENNVLSPRYFHAVGHNPFLMVEPAEIEARLARLKPFGVGLLLDVAHLKVSASALDFDDDEALERLGPLAQAFHLSENDGIEDQNLAIGESAWFWPWLDGVESPLVIEAYRLDEDTISSQVALARRRTGQ